MCFERLEDGVLALLAAEPATPQEVGRALGVAPGRVEHLLERLAVKGLVEADPGSLVGPRWRVAPGIRVEVLPAILLVTSDREFAGRPSGDTALEGGRP